MIFKQLVIIVFIAAGILPDTSDNDTMSTEKNFQVSISFANVKSDKGNIMVAIYDRKAFFLEESKATKKLVIPAIKAVDGAMHLVSLNKGVYAIAVFHDLNENGKLDKNWFQYPVEPFGFSNNVRVITGPPDFSEAAFEVNANKDVQIRLN